MTRVNINLDAADTKNNRIMVNNKDITKSVSDMYIQVNKDRAPSVHLVLSDLAVLNVKGQIDTNVSDLLRLSKKDRQSIEQAKVSKFNKWTLIITALVSVATALTMTYLLLRLNM